MKLSCVSDSKIESYDPSRISYADEAFLLRQMYLTAYLFNERGQIEPWAADRYTFDEDTGFLTIPIRPNFVISNGRPLDAEDLVFSLKRLYILKSNSHGSLDLFLDEDGRNRGIEESWPTLFSVGQEARIKLRKFVQPSLFISLLSNVDTSILPREAVDVNSSSLNIKDYTITSGAYSFLGYSEAGHKLFKKNKMGVFRQYSFPDQLECVGVWGAKSVDLLLNGAIDVIPPIDPLLPKDVKRLEEQGKDVLRTFNVHEYSFSFTDRGIQELSRTERLEVGRVLRSKFLGDLKHPWTDLVESNQFVASISEISLREGEIENLPLYLVENRDDGAGRVSIDKKILVSAYSIDDGDFAGKFGDLPWLHRVRHKGDLKDLPLKEQPHLVFSGSDIAFRESFSFLFYNLQNRKLRIFLDYPAESWLLNYISEPNKEKRIEMARSLQIFNLENAFVIPIGIRPYYATTREGAFPIMNETPEAYLWQLK